MGAKKKAEYKIREIEDGKYVFDVIGESGQVVQTSPPFDSEKDAKDAIKKGPPPEIAARKTTSEP